MRKLKIGCDMDGIIVDLLGAWLRILAAEHGVEVTKHDIAEFRVDKCPKLAHLGKDTILSVLHRPTFFAELPAIPGAYHVLNLLDVCGHEINIVTALPSTDERAAVARRNKYLWLRENLPWIDVPRIHFAEAGQKAEHEFDVFIDDRGDTLEAYAAKYPDALVCGIEYPYNRYLKGHPRIQLAPDYTNPIRAWLQIEDWINVRAGGGNATHH